MIALPDEVHTALTRLRAAGYEAYVVGGCVRDACMGRVPGDYDITTSALPEETETVFSGDRIIETGLKHGTVTVLLNGAPLEITTFRVDGTYSDGRHPDAVSFTGSLTEDLSRRDFTMNAMAFAPDTGFADPFGGQGDIADRVIRCVGDPETRFTEDALRILRALRFAAVLGFSLDPETAAAARKCGNLLRLVSAERIAAELTKLLCGGDARRVLTEYPDILGAVLPEMLPMAGFDQRNPHHVYDVLEHTAAAVEAAPPEPVLRLAALLHDVGKPDCFTLDEAGVGHFYGHAKRSAAMADAVLERLRFDRARRERITALVLHHDREIEPTEPAVTRALSRLTPELFFELLALKRADTLALAPAYRGRTAELDRLEAMAKEILEKPVCLSRRDLALDGDDLRRLGVSPGKAMGAALERALEAVISGEVPNEQVAILDYLRKNGAI